MAEKLTVDLGEMLPAEFAHRFREDLKLALSDTLAERWRDQHPGEPTPEAYQVVQFAFDYKFISEVADKVGARLLEKLRDVELEIAPPAAAVCFRVEDVIASDPILRELMETTGSARAALGSMQLALGSADPKIPLSLVAWSRMVDAFRARAGKPALGRIETTHAETSYMTPEQIAILKSLACSACAIGFDAGAGSHTRTGLCKFQQKPAAPGGIAFVQPNLGRAQREIEEAAIERERERARQVMARSASSARATLYPFCSICGWRRGGQDSWDGKACKCGLSSEPIRQDIDLSERIWAEAHDMARAPAAAIRAAIMRGSPARVLVDEQLDKAPPSSSRLVFSHEDQGGDGLYHVASDDNRCPCGRIRRQSSITRVVALDDAGLGFSPPEMFCSASRLLLDAAAFAKGKA